VTAITATVYALLGSFIGFAIGYCTRSALEQIEIARAADEDACDRDERGE
jgi:hypothetical protein